MLKRISPPLILCVLLGLCGCGKAKATVSGTVKLNNQLVKHGSVVLLGEDNLPHSAPIQPDGTYTVEEVPFGEVRAIVNSPDPRTMTPKNVDVIRKRPGGKEISLPPKVDPRGWVPLPEHYSDPAKSGLSFTVEEDPTTYAIEMKGRAKSASE